MSGATPAEGFARPGELMTINGRCHCGAVSFSARIDPADVAVCHCSDCQVVSGAPFRAVVRALVERFELSGTPKRYVKVAESGNRRALVFCPACGTQLYGTEPENPTAVSIRLGCVEQRAQLRPTRQVWQRSALPWLADLHTVPARPQQ